LLARLCQRVSLVQSSYARSDAGRKGHGCAHGVSGRPDTVVMQVRAMLADPIAMRRLPALPCLGA